jgi:hypothetical protein
LRDFFRGRSLAAAAVLACGLAVATPSLGSVENPIADQIVETAAPSAFETFLDRLMAAESGGRSNAKNPRSTALGPFQFIKGTFLDVTRRHFPAEIAGLTDVEILKLRTDLSMSRRAAAVFCKESFSYLKGQGLEPTFTHLRLAYLLGPADAARIMRAQEQMPVLGLLSAAVINANPFMRTMSVTDLLAKTERDVMRDRSELVASSPQSHARPAARARTSGPQKTPHAVRTKRCNPKLASCRKFLTLSTGKGGKS